MKEKSQSNRGYLHLWKCKCMSIWPHDHYAKCLLDAKKPHLYTKMLHSSSTYRDCCIDYLKEFKDPIFRFGASKAYGRFWHLHRLFFNKIHNLLKLRHS